jgi:DNA-binding response OmpR family regulator
MPKKITKTILIVDDNADILEALELVLTMEGYNVLRATTKAQVEEIVEKNPPHLIMMDVLLSGEDGRNIARDLKASPNAKNIPVLMMSAHPDVAKTIKESGADDFIPKPFKMDDLLEKLNYYLKKRK